ncbi:MAG TPA: alpha/beta fold hydrolase [Steroidobacteraceae bacterium]|jgi:pimeloyl-ACP methyl ester carboxylesterase
MNRAQRAVFPAPSEPRVRRAYFDCRYGQLHVHYAIPAGGGFDEATPLLCIAGTPGSGRFFQPLLAPLGRDRCVYAPDLPGSGESDPVPSHPTSADLALALGDFLDSMHLRHIDLLAHESGVAIALALTQQRAAQVGRVLLSPDTESVRGEARSLRQPSLVIDLRSTDAGGHAAAEFERHANQLRVFLGLA